MGYVGYEDTYTPAPAALARMLRDTGFKDIEYGALKSGMGQLFGDFWPAIPLVDTRIFKILEKLASLIQDRQRLIGGGSFAIGYK